MTDKKTSAYALTDERIEFGLNCNLEDPSDDESNGFYAGVKFAEHAHGILAAASCACKRCGGSGWVIVGHGESAGADVCPDCTEPIPATDEPCARCGALGKWAVGYSDFHCPVCDGRQAAAPSEAALNVASQRQKIIAEFLESTGQYVTNDASREAALNDAYAEGRKDEREANVDLLEEFLLAQDALDNREYQGQNAEDYFVLLRRRNAARHDLDAALAKAGAPQ